MLHHPRPQHPRVPPPLTSTSPPPVQSVPAASDPTYQRFSSPPVHHQQQQQQHLPPAQHSSYNQQQPSYYSPGPASYSSAPQQYYTPGNSYLSSDLSSHPSQSQHSQPQHQQQQQRGPPSSQSPAAYGNDGGGFYGTPFGLNDATTQMGVQFGKHALSAGTQYLDQNLTQFLLPLSKLKHSFNVSNYYVLVKLRLLLWPWRTVSWSRAVERSDVTGEVTGFKPPRDDIHCPDLYIPGNIHFLFHSCFGPILML